MIFRDFSTTGDGIVSALANPPHYGGNGQAASELKACLANVPASATQFEGSRKTPLE